MAVYYKTQKKTATSSSSYIKKKKKEKNFFSHLSYIDGIVGITFPFHAKWEINFPFAILREKIPFF